MKISDKVSKTLIYIGLVLWALINLFPVYWMFTFSLKNNEEIFGSNVAGLPENWLWSNYAEALKTGNMGRYFLNSGIVAVATILITLIVALMATFALTRLIWNPSSVNRRISWQVLLRMIPVNAWIYPWSSARGMNSYGNTSPVCSKSKRINASAVSNWPVFRLKTGWQ